MQLLAYLQGQNRPFNPTAIFENLKRAIPMTALKRELEKLVEQGKASKDIKSRIYWPSQNTLPCATFDDAEVGKKKLEEVQQNLGEELLVVEQLTQEVADITKGL